jgi:hypothetical protein
MQYTQNILKLDQKMYKLINNNNKKKQKNYILKIIRKDINSNSTIK